MSAVRKHGPVSSLLPNFSILRRSWWTNGYQTYVGERCRGNERYEMPNSPWTHIILIGSDISEPAENEHKNRLEEEDA